MRGRHSDSQRRTRRAALQVLFVIGVCAAVAPKPLQLTWWPLARDCTYYTISLGTLAVFFSVTSPQRIVWWEALTLFALYWCVRACARRGPIDRSRARVAPSRPPRHTTKTGRQCGPHPRLPASCSRRALSGRRGRVGLVAPPKVSPVLDATRARRRGSSAPAGRLFS